MAEIQFGQPPRHSEEKDISIAEKPHGARWPSRIDDSASSNTNFDHESEVPNARTFPGFDVEKDSDIAWHYLTFITDLPSPANVSQTNTSDADVNSPNLTPCPDLNAYGSPFLWSKTRKSIITWIACASTVVSAWCAGSYAPGEAQMMAEWDVSQTTATVGITVFTCGFAIAPMFLAPFSEINGRRPVFVVTGLLLVLFQLICAVTPTFAGLLVARFLAGCSSSTFSTMVGGVVSDIHHAQDRNTAMALFSGSAMLGTGLGPLVSGFLAEHTTWRWIFYLQVIICGALMVVIILFFKETRGSVLLSRKAKALNKWYEQIESEGCMGVMMPILDFDKRISEKRSQDIGRVGAVPQRIRWKVKSDEERASIGTMIATSLYRPIHLLVTEPVVFFFSLWVSFAWGVLYLLFSAVPLVFETSHDFSPAMANSVFAAVCIGGIIITIISIYQEALARKYWKRRAIFDTPEGRLFFCCFESVLLPVGCFWFGWSSFPSIPWIVPALAVGCVTMGIFSIYLAVFNYLADAYGRYASSALAAQSFCRNMLGGCFPLFTPAMYHRLTFQGAGSLLGGLAAILTLVPWTLAVFGPKIRAKSKVCSQVMEVKK